MKKIITMVLCASMLFAQTAYFSHAEYAQNVSSASLTEADTSLLFSEFTSIKDTGNADLMIDFFTANAENFTLDFQLLSDKGKRFVAQSLMEEAIDGFDFLANTFNLLSKTAYYIDNSNTDMLGTLLKDGSLGVDTTYYDKLNDQKFVLTYIFKWEFESIEELRYKFDEYVLLCRINKVEHYSALEEIIAENQILLSDVHFRYNSLSNHSRITVLQLLTGHNFSSLNDFLTAFFSAVDSQSATSGGGGTVSGGGGYSPISTYTLDINKNPLTEIPKDGTDIIYTIQSRYQGTPCRYAVAIYDTENNLKEIKLFNSQATQKNYSEFFEFKTKYFENSKIKILTLDASNLLASLDSVRHDNFYLNCDALPELNPEDNGEREGITAYKGSVSEYKPNSYVLHFNDMRAFGYWGSLPEIETVQFSPLTPEIALYDHYPETIYKLKTESGEAVMENVDLSGGKVISFTSDNVTSDNLSESITIYQYGKETTYELSTSLASIINYTQYVTLSECMNNCNYFKAIVKDGVITTLHGITYSAQKVTDIGEGHIITKDGSTYYGEYTNETAPKVDDVVLLENIGGLYRITVLQPYNYTACFHDEICSETSIIIPDSIADDFTEGDSCIAYFDPYTYKAIYIEKDTEN